MIDRNDLIKLTALSRIATPEEEYDALVKDVEAIVSYISKIAAVSTETAALQGGDGSVLRNVMREDGEPHETGRYTDALLKEAPGSERGLVRVKKIISQG